MRILIRKDPNSFELLNPDPGVKIALAPEFEEKVNENVIKKDNFHIFFFSREEKI